MATIPARVKKLEKKVTKLEKEVKALKKAVADHKKRIVALEKWQAKINVWGKKQAAWDDEVTEMLRAVNWAALVAAFPGTGGDNPPQEGPDWPG